MENNIIIVYDGQCPLCRFGVSHIAIAQAEGKLVLLDARLEKEHPVLHEIRRRRLNLDKGMVAVMGGRYFHGAKAIHALAGISTSAGIANRAGTAAFRSKILSHLLYPFLRLGRSMALKAKSVPGLNNLKE